FAHPLAALAILLELPTRFNDAPLVLMPTATERFHSDRLIVATDHRRLVIERVNVAWPAVHEQEDHALGFGSEVRSLRREWILKAAAGRLRFVEEAIGREHASQGDA